MDDGVIIDVVDAGHDPFLEFVVRAHPDVAQNERAHFKKKPSMRLSQDPCFGVKVNSKRPSGC
jgi:hypothetical protein